MTNIIIFLVIYQLLFSSFLQKYLFFYDDDTAPSWKSAPKTPNGFVTFYQNYNASLLTSSFHVCDTTIEASAKNTISPHNNLLIPQSTDHAFQFVLELAESPPTAPDEKPYNSRYNCS